MIQEIDFFAIDLVSLPLQRRSVPAARELLTNPEAVRAFEKGLSKTYRDEDDRVLACMGVVAGAGGARECWAFVASDYETFPVIDRINMVSMCKATLYADVRKNGPVQAHVDGSNPVDVRFLEAIGFTRPDDEDDEWFILDV